MVEAGFVIARGATQPLDIATCEGPGSSPQVPQTFYSFLSLSWAIVADIDIESEAYRCCGPARFEVSTVQRILCMRRYYGRLSYLPADAAPEDAGAESTPATPAGLKRLLPAADAAVPAGWVEEEGETVLFWACNTAWASFESAQTPEAQLSDGCWQLLTISGDNPHLAFCEVLNIAEDPAALANEHSNIRAPRAPPAPAGISRGSERMLCRGAGCIPVKAFRLEPERRRGCLGLPCLGGAGVGHVSLDGEDGAYGSWQCEVHKGLAAVIGA